MSPYETYLYCDKKDQRVHFRVCQAKCTFLRFDENEDAFPLCTYEKPKDKKATEEAIVKRAKEIEEEGQDRENYTDTQDRENYTEEE